MRADRWPPSDPRRDGGTAAGVSPAAEPVRRLRDPDPDGVAMVLAVAGGVLAGAALHPSPLTAGVCAALATVVVVVLLCRDPGRARVVVGSGGVAATGALGLVALALAGGGVAGARAAATHDGVLARLAGRGRTVTVQATVAEEPMPARYGGRWLVLTVARVQTGDRAWRTRERTAVVVSESAGPMALGDRLRLSAGVERAERTDPLGGEPATVLRRPRVLSRAPSRSWPLRASESVRASARARALDSLPPERAGLLLGLALGDTSLEPASVDRAFTTAGLTHLTAVSGQNLALLLAAGLGVAVAFRAGRPTLAVLGILLIVLFALLTRWEPSVLRASAMAVLALLGVATGRGPGGRRALCLAVAVLLLSNPSLLWSLGFQLSVAATAGVLWLGPIASRALPQRLPGPVRSAVGISLGAQAGATPVLALAFGQVSIAGLAANLVAVPIAAAPMLLGVVAAAVSAIPPLGGVAVLACRLADPFLGALIAVAERTSTLPAASVALAGPVRFLPGVVVLVGVVAAHRRAAVLAADEEATAMR